MSSAACATKTLHIKTWGCQMNAYDSQRMADVLAPLGYKTVDAPDNADMIILNTCHIREKATEKLFSELGRMRAYKQAAEIRGKRVILGVAGCVAQAEGDVILDRAPYVDLVFGPQIYHNLAEMVADLSGAKKNRIVNTDFPAENKFDFLPQENLTTGPSAFIAVQEGCDKFCTFCVVPYTRGAEYSRRPQQIVDEVKRVADAGALEIMLLGQNVNAYHGDDYTLPRLMAEIAAKVPAIKRIRYTTSHPSDMTDELIFAHRDIPQVMPYLHLPVQSGSTTILKAMNRKHTREDYLDVLDRLKTARPGIAISGDFIVGFPGETDQDFEDTIDIVKRVGYSCAYSFKYSPRPGTPAAAMLNRVRPDVADHRLERLQVALNEQGLLYNGRFIGTTHPVLFERVGHRGGLVGRTPHNLLAVVKNAPEHWLGQIHDVAITRAGPASLDGEIPVAQAA